MKGVRETICDIIERRALPWFERDGIAKLILPDQINGADCARPIECRRPCTRRHRDHELAIGLAGKATYCIDNKTFIFTPGRIVFLPAGTTHASPHSIRRRIEEMDLPRSSSILWLLVYSFGVVVQIGYVMDDMYALTQPYMFLGRDFSRLMVSLLEEVRSRPLNYTRLGRHILLEFMERCLRAAADTNTPALPPPRESGVKPPGIQTKADPDILSDRVQVALEFIRSSYHMPIDLDDIAEATDSSVNHLGRQFKAATGWTPMQYLLKVRMEMARQLLLNDLNVSEVSHLVGIEDSSYFGRVFRRSNGVSPLQYRRQIGKTAKRHPRRDSTR